MAGPQIVVEMDADEAKMWQKLKKLEAAEGGVEAAMKRIANATKEVSQEHRALERDARRVYDATRTPQERYNQELAKLKGHLGNARISTDTYRRAVDQLNREQREAAATGTSAFGRVMQSNVTQLIGLLGLGGGVAGAIMAAAQATETWLQNMREVSDEAKKAANEIVAFAALQEGGTKAEAVMGAEALAVKFGINDRGEAFNTVQALQSAYGGDLAKGMQSAATVFAATQLGIPIESGRELEVLGASQGQEPGDAIRRAYVSGQASARDPKTIAKAASGISFWKDPEIGYAAAGVISAGVKEDETETYVRRAGIGLSSVSSLEKTWKKQGLENASQMDRLRWLAKEGYTTPEKLAGLGLGEVREQQGIAILARNISEVDRIAGEIRSRAKPGLLAQQRAETEAELPMMTDARTSEVLESAFKSEQAFGAQAPQAMQEDLRQRARGLLYKKAGYTQAFTKDLIDEQGRVGPVQRWIADKFYGGQGEQRPSPDQLELLIPDVIEYYRSRPGTEMSDLGGFELPTRQEMIARQERARQSQAVRANPTLVPPRSPSLPPVGDRTSPIAEQQKRQFESGGVPTIRVEPSGNPDPQMDENNDLLRQLNSNIEGWKAKGFFRPIPVSTSSANNINRE